MMDANAEGLNSLRGDTTCALADGSAERRANRVFAELPTRTPVEAIASWLGPRPTR
ncbi:hypothetical protein HHL19_08835 [Streptomyces sp. R302]|uniref:hypothetical protein n=1 Tax=unclassified Streptomyces TaxID=2593676 RepID=UPI00145F3F35|nr:MULTISPECIES: hypothetical protein [unclassified Streptomyces]NML52935.1 hypothetical protein [Streptomyces sp. R301]NML78770.1 hypothetical protein [Streptomyces sp. R302]